MAHEALRQAVFQANMALVEQGLAVLTWGNASGVDRDAGVMAIKPSGVEYDDLTPQAIVLVWLESGEVIDSKLKPSSDTPTHLELYRRFAQLGGIVHTHSPYATSWAQACREIPCLGTTHADYAYGPIPLTRQLTAGEIDTDYELNTGKAIAERINQDSRGIEQIPAVLVPHHGSFCWGPDPIAAVESAIILEEIACMAYQTHLLNPAINPIPQPLLAKHYHRKHGPNAYYGQE